MRKTHFMVCVLLTVLMAQTLVMPFASAENYERDTTDFSAEIVDDTEEAGPDSEYVSNSGVSLTIDKSTYAPDDSITATLTNNTEERISYGSDYSIERYSSDSWQPVPYLDGVGFTALAHVLNPGKAKSLPSICWPYMVRWSRVIID